MEEAGERTGFHKQVKVGVKVKEEIPSLEEDIKGMRVSILSMRQLRDSLETFERLLHTVLTALGKFEKRFIWETYTPIK